jgi:hypothetical protein
LPPQSPAIARQQLLARPTTSSEHWEVGLEAGETHGPDTGASVSWTTEPPGGQDGSALVAVGLWGRVGRARRPPTAWSDLRVARTAAARAAAEVADGAGVTGPGRGNANAGEASSTSPTSTGRSSASGARSTLAARCRSGGESETASPLPDAAGHEELEGDDTRSSANGGLEGPGSSAAMGRQGNSRSSRGAAASAEDATTYQGDGSKEGASRCPDPVTAVGEGAGGRRSGRRRLRFVPGRHGRERWRYSGSNNVKLSFYPAEKDDSAFSS